MNNKISVYVAILSFSLLTLLLISDYYINYIFSEPFLNQHLIFSNSNGNIENKTLTNTGCDFLNLCDEQPNTKLNDMLFHKDNNVIDISYFSSFIELPFP